MPVPKPATLPRFATGPGATVTAPTEGEKDTGLVNGNPSDGHKMNWMLLWLYKWSEWLNDLANQALTWTAAHIFNAAVTLNGTTSLGEAYPARNTLIRDRLNTAGQVKAWGAILYAGTGAAPTASAEGLNFASVANHPTAANALLVTLACNFAQMAGRSYDDMAAHVTFNAKLVNNADGTQWIPITSHPVWFEIDWEGVDRFALYAFKNDGTPFDLKTGYWGSVGDYAYGSISFSVVGQQAA